MSVILYLLPLKGNLKIPVCQDKHINAGDHALTANAYDALNNSANTSITVTKDSGSNGKDKNMQRR